MWCPRLVGVKWLRVGERQFPTTEFCMRFIKRLAPGGEGMSLVPAPSGWVSGSSKQKTGTPKRPRVYV
jgi:hypothetical protein